MNGDCFSEGRTLWPTLAVRVLLVRSTMMLCVVVLEWLLLRSR